MVLQHLRKGTGIHTMCGVPGRQLVRRVIVVLLLVTISGGSCQSGPDDIGILLAFKGGVVEDPLGALKGWEASSHPNATATPCQWAGISCNRNSRVVSVRLAGKRLNGPIDASIASLPFLKALDLSFNNFSGAVPPALAKAWRLKQLVLSSNLLSGPIPPELGNLTRLQQLELQDNQLTGFIPPQLANCTSLTALYVGGTLPGSLGGLKNLSSFRAAGNNISGGIPADFAHLTSLSDLDLSDNQLGGSLLQIRWGNLTQLTSLSLGYNQFTGNFTRLPNLFGRKHPLQVLSLTKNKLTGSVSEDLSKVWTNLTSIDVSSNRLTGAIPSSLFFLQQLQAFNLGSNSLTGVIPDSLGNCTNLANINISRNSISSAIPFNIYSLTQLSILDLSHNNITGGIPPNNASQLFPELLQLDLSYNSLTGFLPADLGSFLLKLITLDLSHNLFQGFIPISPIFESKVPALQIYDLSANQLTGPVPASLGTLQNLRFLSLFQNRFIGSIPDSLGNCKSLEWLDLQQNSLDGNIPDTLSNLKVIRVFSLSDNNLTGPIPAWIGTSFQELQILNLARNNFVSSFPQDLSGLLGYLQGGTADLNKTLDFEIPIVIKGNVQTFKYLLQTTTAIDVSDNALDGYIPDSLGNLVGLHYLNMSHNSLQGRIPSSLGHLQLLESLDLSVNNLSGEIPSTLSNLPYIGSFNVSYNNLTGAIPTGPQFQGSFGVSSYEGNPGLCGFPLPPCASPPPGPTADAPRVASEESFMDFTAFTIASTASFITGLALMIVTNAGWNYITGGPPPEEPQSYFRRYGAFAG